MSEFTNFIQEMKTKINIRQIAERSGLSMEENGYMRCFHKHSEEPTVIIDPVDQSFRCHTEGCHDHGDIITFTQRCLSLNLAEAVKFLAKKARVEGLADFSDEEIQTFGRVRDCLSAAAHFYAGSLNQVQGYLRQRGVSARRQLLLCIDDNYICAC